MQRTIGIDFEFFNSNEEKMDVVAAVLCYGPDEHIEFDLTDEARLKEFKCIMNELAIDPNVILVAYAAMAEARALLSIGINPIEFNWVDLYVEFRMLCNSNNKFNYGKYINSEGTLKTSFPVTEIEDEENHEETPKNLVNCVYKILGIRLDSEEKERMRDIILSKDIGLIKESMTDILQYCYSDTKYLRALDVGICREFEKEGLKNFRKDQIERGRYAVATAHCEHRGMPIDIDLLRKIIVKTPEILNIHKEEVNKHFPFFLPETTREPRVYKNGKVHHYKTKPEQKDMGAYQTYIPTLGIPDFPKTETGKYKSDKDTLEKYGYWGGLEELWKYNKTESSLKWFNKDNKNGFFDRMGSDNRVRPYYGIFGTQTGRNAAKAKTFPLAMSSWLRAIVRPPEGYCIIAADFSQQEVYVAAVLSGDDAMMTAYKSGDAYLTFAKQGTLVPPDATKKSHGPMRELCKGTVLGLQFGMGKTKLRVKLSLDSGTQVSEELTEQLYTAYKTVFHMYWKWVYEVTKRYVEDKEPLITSDGWTLFCDNPSTPSVRNFLVQATGAAITRRAICLLTKLGINVMCTLHDAVYCVTSLKDTYDTQLLIDLTLKRATQEILQEVETFIRIDIKVITNEKVWVEEKGEKEWSKLKEFLL